MSDGKHGWLTAWGTLIGALAAFGAFIVAYWAYAYPHRAEQNFSITLNSSAGEAESGRSSSGKKAPSLDFKVKTCSVGSKVVSCSLTVVSPNYDRRLLIRPWQTRLIDSDGDTFPMTSQIVDLTLERNEELPFKLDFAVNKDVSRPLTVKMGGHITGIDGMVDLSKGFNIP